jgi:hypothetical protein
MNAHQYFRKARLVGVHPQKAVSWIAWSVQDCCTASGMRISVYEYPINGRNAGDSLADSIENP